MIPLAPSEVQLAEILSRPLPLFNESDFLFFFLPAAARFYCRNCSFWVDSAHNSRPRITSQAFTISRAWLDDPTPPPSPLRLSGRALIDVRYIYTPIRPDNMQFDPCRQIFSLREPRYRYKCRLRVGSGFFFKLHSQALRQSVSISGGRSDDAMSWCGLMEERMRDLTGGMSHWACWKWDRRYC